jgi:ribosomal protein S18 acetylase RimI-like enzyme
MRGVTSFPEGWTTRRPTLDDVDVIFELVKASDVAAIGYVDFSTDDVREALTNPNTDPEQDCWLAFDPDGRLMGWAYPDNPSAGPRDFIEVYVHPDGGEPALRPLLELLLARVAERAASFGHDPITARAGAIPTETDWVSALTGAGFTFVKRYARMTRVLGDVDRAVPVPPSGVVVRAVNAEDDAEMRRFHAVLQEAFADTLDHDPIEYPQWRAKIASLPSVDFDEWFVAEVDGEWAGVLQSADPGAESNEAWVKMLAVQRAYRRRGVGAALLRHAFAAYARKGRTSVGLGVDLANPTAPASLYRAVGLEPVYQADMFERELAAAAG